LEITEMNKAKKENLSEEELYKNKSVSIGPIEMLKMERV